MDMNWTSFHHFHSQKATKPNTTTMQKTFSSHDLLQKHTRTNSATRQGTQKPTLTKSQSVEDFRKKTQVNFTIIAIPF